jgi:outer membrane receptor protein involved in Fe transport
MTLHKHVLLRSTSLAAASAAAWLGFAGLAQAADQPAAAPSTVGEIVVTAGRREEALQKVPVAVAAVSATQIETAGVQNFNDLAALTPNLSVITGVGGSNFLNIRGVGIGVSTPFQSAGVPLMSDGLYIPHSEAFIRDAYFDLDHVEVYRGPQGTFAGQNSTGGAIFVVSKQPDFSGTNGYVQQTVGDYSWFQTQAAYNMPINDQLAARFAVEYETRDGFTDNAGAGTGSTSQGNTGRTLGNLDNISLRGILRWRPKDNLDVRLRYDYLRQADNGAAYVRSPGPGTFNNPALLAHPRTVYEDFNGSDLTVINRVTLNVDWHINDDVELKSISGFQKWYANGVADSDASTPFQQSCLSPTSPTSTTLVPSVCPQTYATTLQTDTYWNQEFDLVSTSASKLQWVVGAAALHQDTPIHNYSGTYCFDPNVLAATTAMGASPAATNACNAGAYANYPDAYAVTNTSPGSKLDYLQSSHSEAGFGELKYQFNDQWQLIAGGRYTWFHIQLNPGSAVLYNGGYYNSNPLITSSFLSSYPGYGGPQIASQWILPGGHTSLQSCGTLPNSTLPNLCILQAQASFAAPTGRAVLNWTPDPKTTVYASWSKGFKQGSYVTQFTVSSPGPQQPYKQEDIYDYELGLKRSLFNNHIRLNLDGFYEDYYNYQASFRVTASPIPRSINIDKSRIEGFEAQIDGVWGDFRTTLSSGFDDSKIVSNSNLIYIPGNEFGPGAGYGPVPAGIPMFDCTSGAAIANTTTTNACMKFIGRPLNYSPKWTNNLTAQYDFHVWGGKLTPWIQYTYVSDQWDSLFHASQDYIPQHSLLNLRISYTAPEHWRLEGFVTNVTNVLYVQGVSAGSGLTPYSTLISLGAPRQMGVRLQYSF